MASKPSANESVEVVFMRQEHGDGEVLAGSSISSIRNTLRVKLGESRPGVTTRKAAIRAQKRIGEIMNPKGSPSGAVPKKRRRLMSQSSPTVKKSVGRPRKARLQRKRYSRHNRVFTLEDKRNVSLVDLTVTDTAMQTDDEESVHGSPRSAATIDILPSNDVFIFGGNHHSQISSKANYSFAAPAPAITSNYVTNMSSPSSNDSSIIIEPSYSTSPYDPSRYYMKPSIHFSFSIPATAPVSSTTHSPEREINNAAGEGDAAEEGPQDNIPQPGVDTPHVNFFQTINNTFKQFFASDAGKRGSN